MAARASAPPGRRRLLREQPLRRWLALGVLAFVGFLYYQPLRTYVETRQALGERSAEVRALAAQRDALEQRLAARTSNAALLREARRLGYVKPGERLFIVKGIRAWRRAHAHGRPRATIGGNG
jgi:cell division protein FtsB